MQTLILVDDTDRFLGYAPRNECHLGDGKRHRAIAVILYNARGEVLLQKRKSPLWDNVWDIAGATHPLHLPDHDESYEEAALRFLHAEWNVATPVDNIFAFTYFERYGDSCENEYCALLAGEHAGEITYNPEYAYGMEWKDLPGLLADIERNPDAYTPWAIIALKKFARHPYSEKLKGRNS